MARKTIEVSTIVEKVNRALAVPDSDRRFRDDLTPDQLFRMGMASVLEMILHETDRYRGFNYNVAPGESFQPGITDETRRHYYV